MDVITYSALQHYWWIIVSVLAGILVFLLFVQGGQTLLYSLAKNEDERKLLVNALGRKWELTFTTLVVFGATVFASFPLFYSTSFAGAYWAWMILLFSFIIQAVSYEYRSKPNNFLGAKTYQIFLFINGMIGTFVLGVIVATLFTGSAFKVNLYNILNTDNPIISQWQNNWHGLEALLNPWNLCLGLCLFFLSRVLGVLYFINTISNDNVQQRSGKILLFNAIPFVVTFLIFLIYILQKKGYGYDDTGVVFLDTKKYWHNLLQMPIVTLLLLLGVGLVLYGLYVAYFKVKRKSIFFFAPGVILVITSMFSLLGFNHTSYYYSNVDMQSSLTLANSSSSYFTLYTMAKVSLLLPLVILYVIYSWFKMNNKPIDTEELNKESHIY